MSFMASYEHRNMIYIKEEFAKKATIHAASFQLKFNQIICQVSYTTTQVPQV